VSTRSKRKNTVHSKYRDPIAVVDEQERSPLLLQVMLGDSRHRVSGPLIGLLEAGFMMHLVQ
jgi:hypothetical protein